MRISTISTLALALVLTVKGRAQVYGPVDAKSTVKFSIKNFGIGTGGDFKGLQGSINWDAADPGKSSFDITVDAATVNTNVESRDNHLRKDEYFNVEQYPKISFKSAKVTASGKAGSFTVYGKLTLKAVTKDISIPFTVTAQNDGYLFEGSFQLNRKDYKIGGSSAVLGDNVTISLSVFAAKK